MQTSKKRLMKRNFTVSKLAVFTLSVFGGLHAQAGDLTLQPSVSSELIFQQIDSETQGDRDLNTLRIEPSLKALYESGKVSASFTGTGTHLERDSELSSTDEDYLEYFYNADWDVIDRLLTVSASGSSSYLNANTDNFLVSDFLTNPSDLARTETNRLGVSSDFTRNPYVSGKAQLTYTKVKTEQTQFVSSNRLNNETVKFNTSLNNGDAARNYFWNVNAEASDTDRGQTNLGSFTSQKADGFFDQHIVQNWAVRLAAQTESHEFTANSGDISTERKFDSVGLGVTYRQAKNRSVSLTANKANSSNPENDGDVYPGVNINWAFTNRTSLYADFGKRFYGDAANVNFQHATRRIRTSLTYSEDVSDFSQLLSNPETLGIFVCPGSSFSLDCFQPNTLNYDLVNGEQLVQILDTNNALEDDVVLRKNGRLQVSYQSRRLTVGVYVQQAKDEYLGQGFERETQTIGTNANYQLGVYTNLVGSISFADINRVDEDGIETDSENTRFSLGLNHQLSRYFSANAEFSYIDRSGEAQFSSLGNDYNEQRLTLGITYRY